MEPRHPCVLPQRRREWCALIPSRGRLTLALPRRARLHRPRPPRRLRLRLQGGDQLLRRPLRASASHRRRVQHSRATSPSTAPAPAVSPPARSTSPTTTTTASSASAPPAPSSAPGAPTCSPRRQRGADARPSTPPPAPTPSPSTAPPPPRSPTTPPPRPVQTALRVSPSVGGSNLSVTGSGTSRLHVTFNSALAATNVAQITSTTPAQRQRRRPRTTTQGSGAYEICTVAADCRAGTRHGGANGSDTAKNGSLDNPQSVAVDGDTGNVYVSDRDNRRVNEYDGRRHLHPLLRLRRRRRPSPATATRSARRADLCQAGSPAPAPASSARPAPPAPRHRRLPARRRSRDRHRLPRRLPATAASTPTTSTAPRPSSFGSSANFGTSQPRKIAVDSRGIVYASNSNNRRRDRALRHRKRQRRRRRFLAPITATNSSPTAGPLLAGPDRDRHLRPRRPPRHRRRRRRQRHPLRAARPLLGQHRRAAVRPDQRPRPAAAPTAADDSHGAAAGFAAVQGLGLNDATGKLYVSATNTSPASASAHRVYILDNASPRRATLDPVTTFDAHSATFSGNVNPNGAPPPTASSTSTTPSSHANGFTNAAKVPIADVDLGAGTARSTSTARPRTTWSPARLPRPPRRRAGLHPDPDDRRRRSPSPPPARRRASTPPPTAGTDDATLRAAINPESQAVTDYHFNWGTDDDYGNSTPVGNLPAGSDPVAVSEDSPASPPAPPTTTSWSPPTAPAPPPGPTGPSPRPPAAAVPRTRLRAGQPATRPGAVPVNSRATQPAVSEDGDRASSHAQQPLAGQHARSPLG